MYLASACLVGINCRYDGDNNYNKYIYKQFKKGVIYPVCPEMFGGLKVPRKPCEIVRDGCNIKIISIDSNDFTESFLFGAIKTVEIAKILDVKGAILLDKSPSCGVKQIYDGSFNNQLVYGRGVTTQKLIDNGFKVYTVEQYKKLSE